MPPTPHPSIAGFSIVRNATILDFPFEAAIASVLPGVDEFILVVGHSDDDTLERARAINDSRIRIVESEWDRSRGPAMLAVETDRAMRECKSDWGICIQADEVLQDGGGARLRARIESCDADSRVEGLLVEYRHFYGGFDTVARNRKWYRQEVRAVRLSPSYDIRSYRDAQGFRVGPSNRRIRAVATGIVMHHYGWARPPSAIGAKRSEAAVGRAPAAASGLPARTLPWIPGLEPFADTHPTVVQQWIAARRNQSLPIAPKRFYREHMRLHAFLLLDRLTGWRPFEFRNHDRVRVRR